MLRIVIDTNIWIRALLGGRITRPLLSAWRQEKFLVICSQALLEELDDVWQRPRLRRRIASQDAHDLLEQLRARSVIVTLKTIPPRCRDPKDHPVLATAIDGSANAIVTLDTDLRADDQLRNEMAAYGVRLWGINFLMQQIPRN